VPQLELGIQPIIVRTGDTTTLLGGFEVIPDMEARIEGTVTLQGQRDHSGIAIHITGPDSFAFDFTTGASGSFTTGNIQPGSYTFRASRDFFLAAEFPVEVPEGQVVPVNVELLFGDANRNGVVDALDLALLGGNVGKTDSPGPR
jgi:hypothetical protein